MGGLVNSIGAFLAGLGGYLMVDTPGTGVSDVLNGLNLMIAMPLGAVFNTSWGIGNITQQLGLWLGGLPDGGLTGVIIGLL